MCQVRILRPPMLDRTDFASWKQCIRLDKVDAIKLGPERIESIRTYSPEGDKDRYNADNLRGQQTSILHGLQKTSYTSSITTLNAKDIWDNVNMLLEVVKLNRGLRDSNYDQLYAYLKQHEAHANENKMMLDRFTQHTVDPLALMSNVSQQQYYSQSSTTPPSTHLQPHFANNTQLDSGHFYLRYTILITIRNAIFEEHHDVHEMHDENKYLEEFLDMKALKEKVEGKLYKQDQSLQTVHMLCKPKPYYNEQNKVAIGYKNPLCLTCAKQVQPALYTGYEIIKNNHLSALVHNTEDTLEIAEITRRKMNDKMKDPECVTHKVKIAPPDYSK
ncbi:hypothetical protein Tco_0270947 [Tanacetum coccineum]